MSFSIPHRPPDCEVHWAGFASTTYQLQSMGWEAAIENAVNQSINYGALHLILRHRSAGWAMYAESLDDYGALRAHAHSDYPAMQTLRSRPRFEVRHCRPDTQMVLVQGGSPHSWGQIDMHPSHSFEQVPVSKLNVFAPWHPAEKEIIVAPDQVADLLERISKLQEPELQAIQRRNQDRDRRDSVTPIRHATILSIAA